MSYPAGKMPAMHTEEYWRWYLRNEITGKPKPSRWAMCEANALAIDPTATRVPGSLEVRRLPDGPHEYVHTNGWQRNVVAKQATPCWHCHYFDGVASQETAALCSNPKCCRSRPQPERGCGSWMREPGADDEPGPPAVFDLRMPLVPLRSLRQGPDSSASQPVR
jgi:hypothetical protein